MQVSPSTNPFSLRHCIDLSILMPAMAATVAAASKVVHLFRFFTNIYSVVVVLLGMLAVNQ